MAERLIPGVGLVTDQTDGEQNLIPGGGLVQEATAGGAGVSVTPEEMLMLKRKPNLPLIAM